VLQLWLLFAAGAAGMSALNAPWVASVSAIWVTIGLIGAALFWVLLSFILSARLRRDEIQEEEGFAPRAPLPDS
jgi:hypothetical protein